MNAGELCIREVVIARPQEPVVEAARRMAAQHVGDLVVVEDIGGRKKPIGIVTDRDLVVAVMSAGQEPVAWSAVGDVMSRDPVVARDTDDIAAVLKSMKTHGVRRLPVINAGGDLEGILTADDILEWLGEQIRDLIDLVRQEQRRERQLRRTAPLATVVGPE